MATMSVSYIRIENMDSPINEAKISAKHSATGFEFLISTSVQITNVLTVRVSYDSTTCYKGAK